MAQGDITRIASNISGLNALNALKAVNNQLSIRQLRLATGKRINEAADDPAGHDRDEIQREEPRAGSRA